MSSRRSSYSCSSIKVEKKDRGIELFNLMIAAPHWAEVRYIVERKLVLRNGFGGDPATVSALNIVPADQELSELAGQLKR